MLLGKIKHKSEESFLLIEKTTKNLAIAISKIIFESNKIFGVNSKVDIKTRGDILSLVDKILNKHQLISGAGFAIYNESSFESWQLTWLYRPQYHRIVNRFFLNKASTISLNYQTFSWFAKVKEAEEGYLHGPYVDYICNYTYTLTYIYPVYLSKQLFSIAATDIIVGQ